MDEHEKMLFRGGQYTLRSFNNRDNLTNTVGFFNNRMTGVLPRNIETESKIFNLGIKNTKDQTKKVNPFFGQLHVNGLQTNPDLEPFITRNHKSCNQTFEKSYIPHSFQPNLMDPTKTVQYSNYIGKNSRFENR